MTTEFKATWSKMLIITSVLTTALILVVGTVVSCQGGGRLANLLFMIPAVCLLFMVRGYVVEGRTLLVKRLGWCSRVDLSGLRSAELAVPETFQGTWRLCGNGGVFSFTGWYRNKALGTFRMFATGASNAVVLRFADRTIVVSPDDAQGFVRAVSAAS